MTSIIPVWELAFVSRVQEDSYVPISTSIIMNNVSSRYKAPSGLLEIIPFSCKMVQFSQNQNYWGGMAAEAGLGEHLCENGLDVYDLPPAAADIVWVVKARVSLSRTVQIFCQMLITIHVMSATAAILTFTLLLLRYASSLLDLDDLEPFESRTFSPSPRKVHSRYSTSTSLKRLSQSTSQLARAKSLSGAHLRISGSNTDISKGNDTAAGKVHLIYKICTLCHLPRS